MEEGRGGIFVWRGCLVIILERVDYIIVLIHSKYLFIIASLFLLFILLYYIVGM